MLAAAQRTVPPSSQPWLRSSATALACAVREGRVSSRALVDLHISRVEEVNPRINAVVATRFQEARAEADAWDARVRRGVDELLPPFAGVPCTIKECFGVEGMPQTAGLVARKGTIAREDATAVARLRAAGAIVLGVTNTSELCMWVESDNRVYGRTRNPHDLGRTAGGSSGGEGAIIAAGGSPFGLGSDIGGSIRMPAFFNGIWGHKPSSGLVPGTGQYPLAHGPALRYLTTGPLARHAEDLMPLLRVLAGPDGQDSACEPLALGDPRAVDIAKLRVLDVRGDGILPLDRDLLRAQAKVADALRAMGARVEEASLRGLRQSLAIWSAMMADAGGPSFRALLENGGSLSVRRELVLSALGRSSFTFPALALVLVEAVPRYMKARTRSLVRAGHALRAELEERLGDDGVMLYPSHRRPAPRHGTPLAFPVEWAYTAILNVLEVPATQVPLGRTRSGVPLGVQVVSARGGDDRTIAVGMALARRGEAETLFD